MVFKDIFFIESPFVQRSRTLCAILVDGLMRKISLFNWNLDQWFRRYFLSIALAALLFNRAKSFP